MRRTAAGRKAQAVHSHPANSMPAAQHAVDTTCRPCSSLSDHLLLVGPLLLAVRRTLLLVAALQWRSVSAASCLLS